MTTPTGGLVLLLVAMVAAYSSSGRSTPARGALAGAVIVVGAAANGENAGDWAFIAVVLGGAWLVGYVVMQRSTELRGAREDIRDLSVRLARAADQLEETQRRLPVSPTPAEVAALTTREVEVVRAIARGMSNAEIADHLSISEWTVKTHVAEHPPQARATRPRAGRRGCL